MILYLLRVARQQINGGFDERRCRSNLLRPRDTSTDLGLVRGICTSAAEQNGKKSYSSMTNQGGLHSSFHENRSAKDSNSRTQKPAFALDGGTLSRHGCLLHEIYMSSN
ncbi:hypothetical protein [Bradyrhizobium sp.]|uniref:hypothetical protein n=1 Tax=Bradyrhizobium sp. TaxID=376 RepID=UPI002D532055|nr:hypothetical protein [Bradyrhizobium sp.]HZR73414.1 hypothetical protein [Bradyrhizobium sp.]